MPLHFVLPHISHSTPSPLTTLALVNVRYSGMRTGTFDSPFMCKLTENKLEDFHNYNMPRDQISLRQNNSKTIRFMQTARAENCLRCE